MKKSMLSAKGFTLIELMIVAIMVSIMAAIAIPSYQNYVVRNAQSEAQSTIQEWSHELERWRAKQLSFRGYRPEQFRAPNAYPLCIPSVANCKYRVDLVDETRRNRRIHQNAALGVGWVAYAYPDSLGGVDEANKYILFSNGVNCEVSLGDTDYSGFDQDISENDCNSLKNWR